MNNVRKFNLFKGTGKMNETLKITEKYFFMETQNISVLKTIYRLVKKVPETFSKTLSCNLRQLFHKLHFS